MLIHDGPNWSLLLETIISLDFNNFDNESQQIYHVILIQTSF